MVPNIPKVGRNRNTGRAHNMAKRGSKRVNLSLYKLTIQPKTFYFFILFRYAIWTSLIPNMKSVFSYHVPFRRYRGLPPSNFDFITWKLNSQLTLLLPLLAILWTLPVFRFRPTFGMLFYIMLQNKTLTCFLSTCWGSCGSLTLLCNQTTITNKKIAIKDMYKKWLKLL